MAQDETVVFDGSVRTACDTLKLIQVSTGSVLKTGCGHAEVNLSAGDYKIDVASGGSWPSGTYWFTTFVKPDPQSFDIAIGQKVENGKIGGVAVAGAGNLETTASKDVYRFHLDTAATAVFDGSGYPLIGSRLVKVSDGTNLGEVRNHHQYDLAAGDYQVEVANTADIGAYSFSWSG